MRALIALFIVGLASGCTHNYKSDPKLDVKQLNSHASPVRNKRLYDKPSEMLAAELIPEGWSIAVIDGVPQDVAPSKFKVSELESVSFVRKNESYVGGELMLKRALLHRANFGLADVKYLLDHQSEIPVALRRQYLVFTGTLLRDTRRGLHIPYLYWNGRNWVLIFAWLGLEWDDSARFVRSR